MEFLFLIDSGGQEAESSSNQYRGFYLRGGKTRGKKDNLRPVCVVGVGAGRTTGEHAGKIRWRCEGSVKRISA